MTDHDPTPGAPTRVRPFDGTQLRPTPLMRAVLGRDPSPTREEYEALVAGLWDGDAPMDALLDWMAEVGIVHGRALYRQALEHGIDSVPNAPAPMKALFALVDRDPPWLDRALLEEGVESIHRTGSLAHYVLRDLALMGGYLLPGVNHALVLTGTLKKGATRRIAETGKWWIDCTEQGGLERSGVGFKTTLEVRMVHGIVRRQLQARQEWSNDRWGVPINQTDMLATYLAFGPFMLLGLRALGIPLLARESRAVMHLWKYAGWLMGVDEKWLVDEERSGLVRLFHTFLTHGRADWTSQELGRALSEEPLDRRYPWGASLPRLERLRNRLSYHQHLSTSRLFLKPKQMERLGLPANVLPWFPLSMLVPRFSAYSIQRLLPFLRRRQQRRGRKDQLEILGSMFGDQAHGIIQLETREPVDAEGEAAA